MQLVIKRSELIHCKDKSVYNNNVYLVEGIYKIKEVCDEDYNCCTYYLLHNDEWIFIGCSEDYLDDIKIDFLLMHT